jgi:hypothetical protein
MVEPGCLLFDRTLHKKGEIAFVLSSSEDGVSRGNLKVWLLLNTLQFKSFIPFDCKSNSQVVGQMDSIGKGWFN